VRLDRREHGQRDRARGGIAFLERHVEAEFPVWRTPGSFGRSSPCPESSRSVPVWVQPVRFAFGKVKGGGSS